MSKAHTRSDIQIIRKFLIVVCSLFHPEYKTNPNKFGQFNIRPRIDLFNVDRTYRIKLAWGKEMQKYETTQ